MQKYLHIIYYACYDIFVIRMCSTPKLSKYATLLPLEYKAIHYVPTDLYSSRFIYYVSPILHSYSMNETPFNLGTLGITFVFQN